MSLQQWHKAPDISGPVALPIFTLLGYGIPAIMYRQAEKQSLVERLREGAL